MKTLARHLLLATFAALAATALAPLALTPAALAQVHASEFPAQQPPPPASRSAAQSTPAQPTPAAPTTATGPLASAHAIPFDQMAVRTMANGGESRDIVHGTLATGETVNLHQSMQVAGATPNPLHVIQHTEFICVREGTLEFQHEDASGKLITEDVGPGGVIYVAFGTKHTVKNVGTVPARYFVIAIGGDAK
jgi:mannose-6-phosphate isomerase-like protein (cupin superfamily)